MSSVIKVNTLQDAGGNSLLVSNGSGSITTNNINVKDIDWQAVVTSDTTMVAGKGYFVDSSGGTKTVTLPASPSIGDTVAINALDGSTNAVTVARNSSNIEGGTTNLTLDASYSAITLVYSDATNGWVRHNKEIPDTFISATGGTATTSGNYKIHTFNSSSNFVVSSVGNQVHTVNYLVVAGGGGGGGGSDRGAGGGAGGHRTNHPAPDSGGLTITAQTYPITIGGGGAGIPSGTPATSGVNGSNSTFSTITSAGGGGGGKVDTVGSNGGSGGGGGAGGSSVAAGGSGNTPPVSPPQGNDGGDGIGSPGGYAGGGGGGSGAAGSNASSSGGGAGGAGSANTITGSSVTKAGGGGSGGGTSCKAGGAGGAGGGGAGANPNGSITAGTANTGGGGGGGAPASSPPATGSAAGGSGVVIIRYKYQ